MTTHTLEQWAFEHAIDSLKFPFVWLFYILTNSAYTYYIFVGRDQLFMRLYYMYESPLNKWIPKRSPMVAVGEQILSAIGRKFSRLTESKKPFMEKMCTIDSTGIWFLPVFDCYWCLSDCSDFQRERERQREIMDALYQFECNTNGK